MKKYQFTGTCPMPDDYFSEFNAPKASWHILHIFHNEIDIHIKGWMAIGLEWNYPRPIEPKYSTKYLETMNNYHA